MSLAKNQNLNLSKIEEYCARYTTPLSPLLDELIKKTYEETQEPQMLSGQLS